MYIYNFNKDKNQIKKRKVMMILSPEEAVRCYWGKESIKENSSEYLLWLQWLRGGEAF